MACVLPQYSMSLRYRAITASSKVRNQYIRCYNLNQHHQNPQSTQIHGKTVGSKRRDVLLHLISTSFVFPQFASVALADTDVAGDFRVYSDDVNKFNLLIPQDWQVGAGEGNGFKSVTAFYPVENSRSNVSVVITGVGADFTRLESFGKVDEFAESLVNGLDRSWQRPPGVKAKLIDSKSANGLYYLEYSLQNPGESLRYIYSVIGMASNGWYNRLYTVTGQFVEEESDKYSSKIEKAVASFRLN